MYSRINSKSGYHRARLIECRIFTRHFVWFTEWMAENGERRLFSQKKFGQTLKAKGFVLFTDGHGVRSVKGIMLKDKTSQDFAEESEQQKSTAL